MAKLTKAQSRTLVRQLIDDENARWWSNANLDLLIALVLDELWTDALTFAPRVLTTLEEPVVVSPGYIDTSVLTQRLFRVQRVTRDAQEYGQLDAKQVSIENDAVFAEEWASSSGGWYIYGSRLYLFPLSADDDVELRYSYLPETFSTLSEAEDVEWPDGFALAYVYEAASRAMMKGGRDVAVAQAFSAASAKVMSTLRSRLEREGTGPMIVQHDTTPHAWGSE
jgi:hypothetical protein